MLSAAEVIVKNRFGHSRRLTDFADGGAGISLPGEEFDCRVQYAVACAFYRDATIPIGKAKSTKFDVAYCSTAAPGGILWQQWDTSKIYKKLYGRFPGEKWRPTEALRRLPGTREQPVKWPGHFGAPEQRESRGTGSWAPEAESCSPTRRGCTSALFSNWKEFRSEGIA